MIKIGIIGYMGKGLESDIVIYLNHIDEQDRNYIIEYIAYTRARFYLYVIEIKGR